MSLLPLRTAADRLGISARTLRQRCALGEIAHKVERGRYYLPAEVVKSEARNGIVPPRERIIAPKEGNLMGKHVGWFRRGQKGIWYRFRGGTRWSSHTADFREAERRWAEATLTVPSGYTRDLTFKAVVEKYQALRSGKRERSVRDEDCTLRALVARWGSLHLSRVQYPEIIEWLEGERGRGLTGRTCNKLRQHLKNVLSFALDMGWLGAMPRLPRPYSMDDSRERPPLDFTVVDALLYASRSDSQTELYLALVALAGLRAGTALSLQWENIDFRRGIITIEAGRAKNRHRTALPLSPALREVLSRHRGVGPVFRHTYTYFNNRVRAMLDQMGCYEPGNLSHSIRHSFATRMAAEGRSLTAIKGAMGHESLASTMRYAHAIPEDVRAAVDAVDFGRRK